jgi:hypothetical protein
VLLDREHNIDINDDFDFWLAEQVLKRHSARAAAPPLDLPKEHNATR